MTEPTKDAAEPDHWCVECQEEVDASTDDECPTCGDETVPMVGWAQWRGEREALANAAAECRDLRKSIRTAERWVADVQGTPCENICRRDKIKADTVEAIAAAVEGHPPPPHGNKRALAEWLRSGAWETTDATKWVKCGCADSLNFGEPQPDCSTCGGKGRVRVDAS